MSDETELHRRMRGVGGFLGRNWYHVMQAVGMAVMAIFTIAVLYQQMQTMKAQVAILEQKRELLAAEVIGLKDQCNKLQWRADNNDTSISEIKVDLKLLSTLTTQMDKKLEVLIELSRPSPKRE